MSKESNDYVCTGTLKDDAGYHAPGDTISIAPGPERDRLLRLGAIAPAGEYGRRRRPAALPEPEGGT